MPKIAIDISPLNDGNSVRGVGHYTRHLVTALQNEVKTNPGYKNFHIDLVDHRDDLRSDIYDLIHYPYFDLFQLTLPPSSPVPFVVTVHDVIPRVFKSHFPVGFRGELKWQFQKHRVRRAKFIIAPSHSAKYEIADVLGYPAEKIYVTYESADRSFRPVNDQKPLLAVRKKFHLPDKFVLYAGDVNWNKNIPMLVRCCLKLNLPLVIAGKSAAAPAPVHPWTEDLRWLQSQDSPLIHILGYVDDADLPLLYNLARVYCQPSLAEGFGLPAVEALRSGTPLIYANSPALSEIADGHGLSFDPSRDSTLESALTRVFSDPGLRRRLTADGLKYAKVFSWRKTALETLAVYDLALNYEE